MSWRQGAYALLCLGIIAFFAYINFLVSISYHNGDVSNLVKIECFLHADNVEVHKFCIDHGYDRD